MIYYIVRMVFGEHFVLMQSTDLEAAVSEKGLGYLYGRAVCRQGYKIRRVYGREIYAGILFYQ